ncbi:PilT protein domain protein [Verminephrobacter eiseniae EF01-2]|uniref:PilT protein domain protein n=2 Tax=Verminephrobacter eiseniae TaxID=364317 RepID=A1WQS2_VEREI|nr:PilT protein domain protein [Verminephrobacter eiseniae EF01-2]
MGTRALMRVVLDTNVLLSALLSPHGAVDAIYRAWQKDRFDLVTSTTQIDELRRASRYAKFKDVLQPHRVGTMVNNMRRSIMLDALPPLADGIEANDPNDRFLLAMTLAGDADDLVTGDHRAGLLQRGSLGRTRIITPVTFCAEAL